jgi:PQQ-dependent catabolism-associated CXXCW motif protein
VTAFARRTALAIAAVLLVGGAGAQEVPEPPGYRMGAYRTPTPATLSGARVLSTDEVRVLWESKEAAFIDVLPYPPKPAGLPAGTIWHPRPRFDIPGSVWLPDTGYGELAPAIESYFRDGLAAAAGHDPERMVVFYCLRDCWMSWNAAKRAIIMGYPRVGWYPEGTDGWEEAHLPLEQRVPVPRPGE